MNSPFNAMDARIDLFMKILATSTTHLRKLPQRFSSWLSLSPSPEEINESVLEESLLVNELTVSAAVHNGSCVTAGQISVVCSKPNSY